MARNAKKVFILVLLTLLFTFVQAQTTETAAQIEVNGTIIENGTVSADEISSYYEYYLQYYGSLDPLFEEPYVKAFILNELVKERLTEYLRKKMESQLRSCKRIIPQFPMKRCRTITTLTEMTSCK